MSISGVFSADGVTSEIVLKAGESLAYALDTEAFSGTVYFEKLRKDNAGYDVISQHQEAEMDTLSVGYKNDSGGDEILRLRCEGLDADESEEITYSIVSESGEPVEAVLIEKDGKRLAYIDDLGRLNFDRPIAHDAIPAHDSIITNDSAAVSVSVEFYETQVSSSGSEGT